MEAHVFEVTDDGEAALEGAPSSVVEAMEKRVWLALSNGVKGCEDWGKETV